MENLRFFCDGGAGRTFLSSSPLANPRAEESSEPSGKQSFGLSGHRLTRLHARHDVRLVAGFESYV